MTGDGTSIGRVAPYVFRNSHSQLPNNNRSTVIKIILVVTAIAIFWGFAATSSLVPQIFATTQAQIISTSIFASAGMFIGIVGFSVIATTSWNKRPAPYARLTLNTRAAFKDHKVDTSALDLSIERRASPLVFMHAERAIQGTRKTMEDVSFCVDLPMGKLVGVFDGHGGATVAQTAAAQFPLIFPVKLKENEGDVERAFKETFHQIQTLIQAPEIEYQKGILDKLKKHSTAAVYREHTGKEKPITVGAAASVVFIDKKNRAFVATLGDTHTFAFKKERDKTQVYPLSPNLTFKKKEEARRVGVIGYKINPLHTLYFDATLISGTDVDCDSLYSPLSATNCSRALETLPDPGVSHEPVVSVLQLNRDSVVLIGCDGVWKFVDKPKHFMKEVIEKFWNNPGAIPQATVRYASRHHSNDNISAIAVWARR
ncbi:MAG: hypothetical protein K1000chlam4_00177 [Chlamydiae bacterium]|nr:hypothetical protein [Chlamydiota bacterium]